MDKKVDKQLDMLMNVIKLNIDREQFLKQISLFSWYLAAANEDYKYNKTYLENFSNEFIIFKRYVELKNDVYAELFKLLLDRSEDIDIRFSIDDFWMCKPKQGEGVKANPRINPKCVCCDKIKIKGYIEWNDKKFIFSEYYNIIKNWKLIKGEVEKLISEFSKWIDEVCNG